MCQRFSLWHMKIILCAKKYLEPHEMGCHIPSLFTLISDKIFIQGGHLIIKRCKRVFLPLNHLFYWKNLDERGNRAIHIHAPYIRVLIVLDFYPYVTPPLNLFFSLCQLLISTSFMGPWMARVKK